MRLGAFRRLVQAGLLCCLLVFYPPYVAELTIVSIPRVCYRIRLWARRLTARDLWLYGFAFPVSAYAVLQLIWRLVGFVFGRI